MNQKKDVIVIGSGPAGYVCAIRLAQLGKKVTIIDKSSIGGVCLNRGCIPSKALITAGTFYEKLSHSQKMGITVGSIHLDFTKLMSWKDSVVNQLTKGVEGLLKANNVEILNGVAHFKSEHEVEVNNQLLSFNQCVICTGSLPLSLPFLPVDNQSILDSTSALSLKERPDSLICVGGGYIGLELGTFYAKIGTKVTIVEAASELLAGFDPEITKVLLKRLKELNIEVHLNTKVTSAEVTPNSTMLHATQGDSKVTLKAQKILVTIGRKPHAEGLHLQNAHVECDSHGFIKINTQCQTNKKNIYAIGDIAGQPLLAHKGSAEAFVAAEAIAGKKTHWNHKAIPAVIFTDPEIATVGLTEAQAKTQGIDAKSATFPFAANGRALSLNEPYGFVKLVFEPKGRLLGFHIVGPEASQLISEGTLAIEMGAYIDDLALTIHPHPTLSEVIMEAAHVGMGHAIHIFKK